MKWGFASTAAIVRSIQKDFYYRKQIEEELKLVLLDHVNVGWYLKVEQWLPLLVDLFYYGVQSGTGTRTLGEAYSRITPVDLNNRDFLLKNRIKRVLWVLMSVLVPFLVKRGRTGWLVDLLSPLNLVLFYCSGNFPSITSRILSIRYIFYPRKPPNLDGNSTFYKGLALTLGLISLKKFHDHFKLVLNEKSKSSTTSSVSSSTLMKPAEQNFKCPVCYESFETTAFCSVRCGHVYCWHCIAKWMSDSAERDQFSGSCPVCRVPCDPPDLLPLLNFK